jgi:hypothetical protein
MRGKQALIREMTRMMDTNALIAACNLDGMIHDGCHVTSENTCKEDFEHYVIDILGPHLTSYPGIFFILALD